MEAKQETGAETLKKYFDKTPVVREIRILVGQLIAHPTRVTIFATSFIASQNLIKKPADLLMLITAFLGHDIGKFFTKDGLKIMFDDRKIDRADKPKIIDHPDLSARFFKILGLKKISEIVKGHHEKWNGKGYPNNLSKKEAALYARILKIVDSFDAISAHRNYDPAHSIKEALDELRAQRREDFDPGLVESFCRFVERHQRLFELLLLKFGGAKSGRNFSEAESSAD